MPAPAVASASQLSASDVERILVQRRALALAGITRVLSYGYRYIARARARVRIIELGVHFI
jgi:hypothetical protein